MNDCFIRGFGLAMNTAIRVLRECVSVSLDQSEEKAVQEAQRPPLLLQLVISSHRLACGERQRESNAEFDTQKQTSMLFLMF